MTSDQIKPIVDGYGGCTATDRIVVDGCPVGYMYREKPINPRDSGWNCCYQIKNPGKKEESLIQLAGVESVLRAYEAIVVKDSKGRITYLDELLGKQRQGVLKDKLAPKITKGCARVSAA